MDLKLALETISIKEKNKYNGSVNNSSTPKSNNSVMREFYETFWNDLD